MKAYIFGYLFVRLNKLAAILCVVAGVAVAFFFRSQASIDAESAKYRENDLLRLRLNKLQQAHQNSKQRVLRLRTATTFPPEYSVANKEFSFDSRLATSEDFLKLQSTLNGVQASNAAMKSFVIARFDELVESISEKLLAHAKQLAPVEKVPPRPMVLNVNPSGLVSVPDREHGIFSIKLSKAEVNERAESFKLAKSFLQSLQDASENPENKEILGNSLAEVDLFMGLLPSFSDFVQKPPARDSEVAPPLAQQPRAELNAERVAGQLNRIKLDVTSAVLSDWAVDDAIEGAVASYSVETEKCRQAEAAVQRIWHDCIGNVLKALIASIALAFILLVLADLTRAILDTAASTGVVADAYRAAIESPSEAE